MSRAMEIKLLDAALLLRHIEEKLAVPIRLVEEATEGLLPARESLLDERDLYRAALHAIDGTSNRPPSEAHRTLVDCHMIASAALVSGKKKAAAALEVAQ